MQDTLQSTEIKALKARLIKQLHIQEQKTIAASIKATAKYFS